MKNSNDLAKEIVFFYTGFVDGGGERVTVDVARALKEEGINIKLVFLYRREDYKRIPEGLPTEFIGARRLTGGVLALSKYIKKQKPTTILSTQEHAHIVSLIARILSGCKIRIVLRFGLPPSKFFQNMKSWKDKIFLPMLARVIFPLADAVIANSKITSAELVARGIPKEKVDTIYNPLPFKRKRTDKIHPWLNQFKTETIMSIGRLEPQKDFATLIKAFAIVRGKISSKSVRLLIFGSGGQYENLVSLAKELGVEDTVAIERGFLDNPIEHMEQTTMFVLPSRFEGFPSVLIEALSAGIAVVSTDCISGPREILAPDSLDPKHTDKKPEWAKYGGLVPVGGVDAMAEAITQILTDTDLRRRYAAKGKERSFDFTMDKVLPGYKRVLRV